MSCVSQSIVFSVPFGILESRRECLGTGMEPVVPDPVVVENAGRQFTWMSWSGNMLLKFIIWATRVQGDIVNPESNT